jgi:hypothetical protein
MEKSNTVHIINLNGFLEKNRLAQHLLEHNQKMEPNLNFKIWTENDPEIKEGTEMCNFYLWKEQGRISHLAGAYLPNYILYLYGGIYCEMDYEFLIKDYFSNLIKKTDDFLLSSLTWTTITNCGNIGYFPYKGNKVVKNNLIMYDTPPDEFVRDKISDVDYISFNRALHYNLYTKEELFNIKKNNLLNFIDNLLLHYEFINECRKVYVCSVENYSKYHDIFDRNDKVYFYSKYDDRNLETYYYRRVFSSVQKLNHILDTIHKYTDKEVVILDNIEGLNYEKSI